MLRAKTEPYWLQMMLQKPARVSPINLVNPMDAKKSRDKLSKAGT
jgi:hypothetical protein